MISINSTNLEDDNHSLTNNFIPNQFCSSLTEIDKQNDCGWTPLYRSIIAGNLQASESLIKFGANPNIQCNMGETSLFQAVDMDKIDHVKLLLKHKADPNITQSDGHTPLHQAVMKQYVNIVEVLLSNAANPNIKSKVFEMTPVHFAIKNNVNPTILLLLVQYNGSLVLKDKNDKRPIDYVNSDEMRETLKKLRLQKEDIFRTPSKERSVSFNTPSKLLTVANNLAGNNYTESAKREFDIYGNTVTQDAGNTVFHFVDLNRKTVNTNTNGNNNNGSGQGQPPSCSNSKKKRAINDVKRKNDMNTVKCDLFQQCNEVTTTVIENITSNHICNTDTIIRKAENDNNNNQHCYYYTTDKKYKIYSPIKESKEEEYYYDTDPSKSIAIKSKRSIKSNYDEIDINKEKALERDLIDTEKNKAVLTDSIHLLSHHNDYKYYKNNKGLNDRVMNKENINNTNIGSNLNAITIINLQTNSLNHSNNSNSNSNSYRKTIAQYPNNSFTILSPRDNIIPISNILQQKKSNPNHNNLLLKQTQTSNEILITNQLQKQHNDSLSYTTQSNNNNFNTIDSSKLYEWLYQIELQFYFPLFIDKGIYSIDKIIEDMHSERIIVTYKDIQALGIKKPGHVYRILVKLEIDAQLINKKIADFISPFNYVNSRSINMRISKEYICCCGVSQQHSSHKFAMNYDINGWLKNAALQHLKDNFEFNGFELMEYFVLQMFSSVPIDDEIILECLHVYNDKERDMIMMELNRNVRYVVKKVNLQMSSIEMIKEKQETNCKMCIIF